MKNMFCSLSDLSNEASVEVRFVGPLLKELGYSDKDIALKTSIREFRVGKGSKSMLYKPDFVLSINGIPAVVIDAKAPTEPLANWEQQCSSYCLELNKLFEYHPVQYYVLTNGAKTIVYQWDRKAPLLSLEFFDFTKEGQSLQALKTILGKSTIRALATDLKDALQQSYFAFDKIGLSDLVERFQRIHQYVWTKEKMTPSAAFQELIKVVFVKIHKDKELHRLLGTPPKPKYKDVVFSGHWIAGQTENVSPINDPLFRNLLMSLEADIQEGKKKRIFDKGEEIRLTQDTIKWIVKQFENVDFFAMEEDVHGRMFEAFLDATARGPELGQFFTPRDIVNLMVNLASIEVTMNRVGTVLDACCGSGGFLISAMSDMIAKAGELSAITDKQRTAIEQNIKLHSLYGIDAGNNPPIYRIGRMNMYLHGDGGSNIYFADALDKSLETAGKLDLEGQRQLKELRELLLDENKKFDVILSNPPFSLKYSRDDVQQAEVLNQYEVSVDSHQGKILKSLLSSVMFLERYRDLVADDGKILAVIDESVLSGQSYDHVRRFIRKTFVILGVISLPGDAFKRASARVKTSILILRLRKNDEAQSDVFMAKSIYLGLEPKIAKRIGLNVAPLEQNKADEAAKIISAYRDYEAGKLKKGSPYIVPATRICDRLDVKYCVGDRGRRSSYWSKAGLSVGTLGGVLALASGRGTKVATTDQYQFLRVTYDGDVVDGDLIEGEDCSYSTLYRVEAWDLLLSNMGVGRGAVGIIPPHHAGKYVSNEYTIATAKSEQEAMYYCNLLRTKEILGDILSTTTGMNRGRIHWDNISDVKVPLYVSNNKEIVKLVSEQKALWDALEKFQNSKSKHVNAIVQELGLEDAEAHNRWLAYKPPE